MTRAEFGAIIEPFRLAMRADLDALTLTAYFRVLKDVPGGLFASVVDDLMRSATEFFPKAPELLAACERRRRQALALMPYTGCVDCEDQIGWRTVKGEDGYERMERCPCRARHQERLADHGVLASIAQLPGEAEPQAESYHPSAEQLPAELRARMLATVRQKVMR